jgi:type I restriction enzyme R subunit
LFATQAIATKIDAGQKTKESFGIHAGSGKTALAYYNVKHLTVITPRKIIQKILFYMLTDWI